MHDNKRSIIHFKLSVYDKEKAYDPPRWITKFIKMNTKNDQVHDKKLTISPRENAVMDKGQKGDGITKR